MKKLKYKQHDFSSKLRQESIIDRLKAYIIWQRGLTAGNIRQSFPEFGPVSINLDLTSACNFSCPHCVDSTIINTRDYLGTDTIKLSIDTLLEKGLRAVILIGGGEPTLHKDFTDIVRYIKSKSLQVGIVTNGTRLDSVACVAELLGKNDWVRLSIDAATQETFNKSHRPKTRVSLYDILDISRRMKNRNPHFQLGYSFVIVWEGISLNGHALCPNVHEMPDAVHLASEYGFDYISFKPCLIRLKDTQKESLLEGIAQNKENLILNQIKSNLQKAKKVAGRNIGIIESVNLRAMLEDKVHELKLQPQKCHMQFFSFVLSPSGIFHCPAFRGVEKGRIADSNGFTGEEAFDKTLRNIEQSILSFDAENECNVVGCFYHHVNWWLENFIHSGKNVDEIEKVKDDNFFL